MGSGRGVKSNYSPNPSPPHLSTENLPSSKKPRLETAHATQGWQGGRRAGRGMTFWHHLASSKNFPNFPTAGVGKGLLRTIVSFFGGSISMRVLVYKTLRKKRILFLVCLYNAHRRKLSRANLQGLLRSAASIQCMGEVQRSEHCAFAILATRPPAH